jgi:hypothetical protein
MLYVLLFYGREEEWERFGPAERRGRAQAHIEEVTRANADGALIASARLLPTDSATTLRASGEGVTVLDGPFAETKEQLGGLQILDCQNLDAALGYAKMCTARGGTVEIRPVHPDPDCAD